MPDPSLDIDRAFQDLRRHTRHQYRRLKADGTARKFAEALRKTGFDPSGKPDLAALTRSVGDEQAAHKLAQAFSMKSPDDAAPRIIGALGPDNDLTGPIVAGVATILFRGGLTEEEVGHIFHSLSEGKLTVTFGKLAPGSAPTVSGQGDATTVSMPPPPEKGDEGNGDDGGTGTNEGGGGSTGGNGGTGDGNGGDPNPDPDPQPDPEPDPNPTPPTTKGFWGLLNALLTGAAKGAAVGGAGGALAGVGTGPGAASTTAYGAGIGVVVGGTIGGGAYIFGGVMTLPDGSGDLVWW